MKAFRRSLMQLRNNVPIPLSSFHPSFKLNKSTPADVAPLMKDVLDRAALQSGINDYGWTRSGQKLIWRAAYDDSESMLAAFEALKPKLNEIVQAGAEMDRIEFVGPGSSLSEIRDKSDELLRKYEYTKPEYYETQNENQTGYFRKSPVSKGSQNATCFLISRYTIHDWEKTLPVMQQVIDRAFMEPGCIYFGWAKSGNKLNSREIFADGNAMREYLEHMAPFIEQFKSGHVPIAPDKIEVHGPEQEIRQIEGTAFALNTRFELYFEAEGFAKDKVEKVA